MRLYKTTPSGTFGTEQLYKIVFEGKTVESTGPLSGTMSYLACRILNGENAAKVLACESRNYAARVMEVVNTIKN
jgi:hypothetical protein